MPFPSFLRSCNNVTIFHCKTCSVFRGTGVDWAFQQLDPIPQFKATAKLGEFLDGDSHNPFDQLDGSVSGHKRRSRRGATALYTSASGESRLLSKALI
jgi:hypothetical protein